MLLIRISKTILASYDMLLPPSHVNIAERRRRPACVVLGLDHHQANTRMS